MPFADNITYLERNHRYATFARSCDRGWIYVFRLNRKHRRDETEKHL